jgi:hypothetical protein
VRRLTTSDSDPSEPLARHIRAEDCLRQRAALTIAFALALLCGVSAAPAQAHKLSLAEARQAAQKAADAYAGQPTQVTTLLRLKDHRFYAQAQWERAAEPFNQFCFSELTVKFASKHSDKVIARVTGFACF